MAEAPIRLKRHTYAPAAAGVSEGPINLMQIKKGERILYGSIVPMVAEDAGATGTISIGDAGGAATLLAATTVTAAASPLNKAIDMAALGAHGKIYTADDTITATWTFGTNATAIPQIRVEVAVVRGEQF